MLVKYVASQIYGESAIYTVFKRYLMIVIAIASLSHHCYTLDSWLIFLYSCHSVSVNLGYQMHFQQLLISLSYISPIFQKSNKVPLHSRVYNSTLEYDCRLDGNIWIVMNIG